MRFSAFISATVVLAAMEAPAVSKPPPPDKELLRMMDLLTDWEVIQHMEKMKELEDARAEEQKAPRAGTRAPSPGKRKEAAK
jgi:hypothetical protein